MLRLFNARIALVFHAYLNLKTVEEHHITVKQLCHSIGYSGNNHLVIKQALKGLIATVIEWDVLDSNTGKEDWTASSILASVHIKGPDCFYSYSPPMRELLYSPTMYAKINLVVQAKFKSNYGLALYENCIRYQGLP
nr:replication initiation protein [Bacteroidota bacterium]